jgi:hypothetical protein
LNSTSSVTIVKTLVKLERGLSKLSTGYTELQAMVWDNSNTSKISILENSVTLVYMRAAVVILGAFDLYRYQI